MPSMLGAFPGSPLYAAFQWSSPYMAQTSWAVRNGLLIIALRRRPSQAVRGSSPSLRTTATLHLRRFLRLRTSCSCCPMVTTRTSSIGKRWTRKLFLSPLAFSTAENTLCCLLESWRPSKAWTHCCARHTGMSSWRNGRSSPSSQETARNGIGYQRSTSCWG